MPSFFQRFLVTLCFLLVLAVSSSLARADRKPNFIVIFCDDLGYGDLGCFGSTKIATPNIDRMAKEGMRLTSFYSTSGVCTPSRSSLMTGCYPRRVDMHVNTQNLCVLFPADRKGLNPTEDTIADVLKRQGYATACIGKWHLGDQPAFLPTKQGFDYYFGIPYSNDMHRKNIPLPLLRNEKVIESPVKQPALTGKYTQEVIQFIEKNKDRPFFIYLPHTFPHVPLFASKEFKGKSKAGIYGDTVEEIDWSTGQILAALKKHGLDDNTLVLFTSDNGSARGSNAPLRGRKGTTFEGGQRVPCVVRWPKHIAAGTISDELSVTFDLLPTFAKLAGATLGSKPIDGKDIAPLLFSKDNARSPHEAFFYYQMDQLQAVRAGKWKMFVPMESKRKNWGKPIGKTPLELYNLDADIAESKNVAADHPDVVSRLKDLANQARSDLGDVGKEGKGQREAAWVKEAWGLTQVRTPPKK